MSASRVVKACAVFAVLSALHYSLRPLLGWRAGADFLLIAVLLTAVRVRPGTAAVIGFVSGLASDALTPESFGAAALAYTTVAWLASWLKAVFFADNFALNGIFFFLGKWAADLIIVIAERQLKGLDLLQQVLLWSPLSALVTAIAGLVLLIILRPLLDEPAAP